jgi:hypothetical protein
MRVTAITISAAQLAFEVSDTESAPLNQCDCKQLPIVDVADSGRVEIVDGFHRIAGMILAGETAIACLICDDDNVIADAANGENAESQERALAAIYAAA